MALPTILKDLMKDKKTYRPHTGAPRPMKYKPEEHQQKVGNLKKMGRAFRDQMVDGNYDDSMKNENASLMTRRMRALVVSGTKNNPFARRVFDTFTNKEYKGNNNNLKAKKPAAQSSKFSKIIDDAVKPSKVISTDPNSINTGVAKDPILTKIFGRLGEIKQILADIGNKKLTDIKKGMKRVIDKPSKRGESSDGKKSSRRKINKRGLSPKEGVESRKPKLLDRAKPSSSRTSSKGSVNRSVERMTNAFKNRKVSAAAPKTILKAAQAVTGAGSAVEGAVAGQAKKGLAARLMPAAARAAGSVARLAGPAAAVAASGYAGYQGGKVLNNAMDGTAVGENRDKILNSVFSGADHLTGGGISGNKDVAKENWDKSWLGSKFVKDSDQSDTKENSLNWFGAREFKDADKKSSALTDAKSSLLSKAAPVASALSPAFTPTSTDPSKVTTGAADGSVFSKIFGKLEEIKLVLVNIGEKKLAEIKESLNKAVDNPASSEGVKKSAKQPGVKYDEQPKGETDKSPAKERIDSIKNKFKKDPDKDSSMLEQQAEKRLLRRQTARKSMRPSELPDSARSAKIFDRAKSLGHRVGKGINASKSVVNKSIGKMTGSFKPSALKAAPETITGAAPKAIMKTVETGAGSALKDAAAGQIEKSMLSRLMPSAGKMLSGAGRVVGSAARFAAPAAAVAAAGYAGYQGGKVLNKAMDGTWVGENRDKAFDSVLSGVDNLTGGGISGNKEVAKANWDKSWLGSKMPGAPKSTDAPKPTDGKIVNNVIPKMTKDSQLLQDVFGKNKEASKNIGALAPELAKELESQGIATTDKQKAMVYGQIATETGGFRKMEEGKYSASNVWGLRGKQLAKQGVKLEDLQAAEKSGGKDAMYEYMYGDKYRSGGSRLGNKEDGDAAKYKGRGMIQLTGRNNYEKAGKDLGLDLISDPEQITRDPAINAKVTAWHLKHSKASMEGLKTGDIDKLSQGINGGAYGKSNGRDDRIAQTEKVSRQMEAAGSKYDAIPEDKVAVASTGTVNLEKVAATPAPANLEKVASTSASSSNLEKVASTSTGSDKLEKETLAANKPAPQQPIILQQGNKMAAASPPQTGPASTPAAAVIPRNTETSISRITDSQMGYGIA